jgi:hypothetical protein
VQPSRGGLSGGDELVVRGQGFPSAVSGVQVVLSFHVPSTVFPDSTALPVSLRESVPCIVTSVSSSELRCTLQPFPHASLASASSSSAGSAAWEQASAWDHDVTVTVLPGGEATLAGSFVTLASAFSTLRSMTPAVVEVAPQQGSAAGGSLLRLLVTRLSPSESPTNVTVSIGGCRALVSHWLLPTLPVQPCPPLRLRW